MNRRFARIVSASLVVATTALTLPAPASARLIGTEEAAGAAAAVRGAPVDRDFLRSLLDREDVRSRLEAFGVDSRQARERVDALTDDEVSRLAGRLEQLPAGGDGGVIGVIFAVFLILLVTDILGFTKIFPFTRSIR